MSEEVMKVSDFLKLYGISPSKYSKMKKEGIIPDVRRIGRAFYVVLSSISEWEKKAKVLPKTLLNKSV
jgi:hypothetical protein